VDRRLQARGVADVGAAARQDRGGIEHDAVVAEREAPQGGLRGDAPAADAAALGDVSARRYEAASSTGSASGSAASGAGSSGPPSSLGMPAPSPSVSSTPGTSSASSSGGAPPT
jgi:hypothetical protein